MMIFFKERILTILSSEPEVGEFDRSIPLDEEIGAFQVSVHDAFHMAEINRLEQLHGYAFYFRNR